MPFIDDALLSATISYLGKQPCETVYPLYTKLTLLQLRAKNAPGEHAPSETSTTLAAALAPVSEDISAPAAAITPADTPDPDARAAPRPVPSIKPAPARKKGRVA